MPVLHTFDNSVQLVKSSKDFPIVILKSLKQAHQLQIWQGIKNTNIELSELLAKNKDLEGLKQALDGQLVMSRDDAERYYKAGKNNE